MSSGEPLLRIGELARRSGIPAATLRAWERRYGVVTPLRTESRYRLYDDEDLERLRMMARLVRSGTPASLAAKQVEDALAPRLRADLLRILDRVEGDPEIRALVITGAGEHFCSGGDLSGMDVRSPLQGRERLRAAHQLIRFGQLAAQARELGGLAQCLSDILARHGIWIQPGIQPH